MALDDPYLKCDVIGGVLNGSLWKVVEAFRGINSSAAFREHRCSVFGPNLGKLCFNLKLLIEIVNLLNCT